MKKTLVMAIAALTMSLSAQAVRAIHKLFPIKQSDGTTVMLYKNGDGHLAFYTTEDGQVVVPGSDGMLYYAKLTDGNITATSVRVHNISERTEAEKAFILQNTLKPSDAAYADMQTSEKETGKPVFRILGTSTSDGLGKLGQSASGSISSVGSPTIPVIMVEFSDVKFQPTMTVEKYSRFMNEPGYKEDSELQRGSVKDYFAEMSRGMFMPTFDVVAKVTLDKSYAYYGANSNNSRGNDKNVMLMVREAISGAINLGADFTKYVVNNKIPNVIILYAGYGEATGGDANTIWPHERDLSAYSGVINGYTFGSYFVGNELNGSSGTQIMGMGVMVHELGHALGLPDIYDPTYSYSNDAPMGSWSVMESGPYVNGSYAPMGYNAYERSYLGWLDIRELKDAESVVLDNQNQSEGEFAVMLRNPSDRNEYFIMENRQPGTWFQSQFGSGLLVTRYAFNSTSWMTNSVNTNQSYKRAIVVTATRRNIKDNALESDLYGNGVNNITSFPLFSQSTLTDMPVYKILKNSDGIITFNFKDRNLPTTYCVTDETSVFEKVTDATTLSANDVIAFVNEADGVAFSSAIQGNNRAAVAVKIENGRMFGNQNVQLFTLLSGANNLWGFRSNSSYLSAGSSGIKFATRADANCLANVTIDDGNASIIFAGTAKCKNLGYSVDDVNFTGFIDSKSNIQIYRKSSSTGISNAYTDKAMNIDSRMYNLSGQQVGEGYKGIVIVNGKKMLKK